MGIEYFLKDYFHNRYVSSEEMYGQAPKFSEKARPDLFEIHENASGIDKNIIKVLSVKYSDDHVKNEELLEVPFTSGHNSHGSMVLDISPNKNTLIYFPFYEGKNQYIEVVKGDAEDKYRLMHDDKCIGYNNDVNIFELVSCQDIYKTQWFALIKPKDYNPTLPENK
ncbi:hypothetical protein GVAV_003418 [Gurleya vavrai]